MSISPARNGATLLSAAAFALALMPVPVSSQAPPSAREQLVWHWFGACTSGDSLILEFHVDGKLVYSSAFPICHLRRSDIGPEPQQRLLTFRFDAAPRRFGTQYRASEPEPIIGTVWEAGQKGTAIVLGVSFATVERVLLNTRHVARPDTPARSEWIRGLELITRPVHRAERTPSNKRLKLTAPGFGRNSVCAATNCGVVSIGAVPASVGARSLSAIR